MNKWNCDKCGKRTYVNPRTKPKVKKDKDGNFVPDMGVGKRQNLNTGEIEEYPVQKVEHIDPKAYIIRISVGFDEYIQRDFCKECLDDYLPEIKKLWSTLEGIKPQ